MNPPHDDERKLGIWLKHFMNYFLLVKSRSLGIQSNNFMNQPYNDQQIVGLGRNTLQIIFL